MPCVCCMPRPPPTDDTTRRLHHPGMQTHPPTQANCIYLVCSAASRLKTKLTWGASTAGVG